MQMEGRGEDLFSQGAWETAEGTTNGENNTDGLFS